MKKRLVFPALSAIVIVLELLPFGAVLNFANPQGEAIRRTYSYFDLTPYGYANFGPFLTALLTCVLLLLAVVYLFRQGRRLRLAIAIVCGVALLCSLLPLLYGLRGYSVVGALISVTLLAQLIVSLQKDK